MGYRWNRSLIWRPVLRTGSRDQDRSRSSWPNNPDCLTHLPVGCWLLRCWWRRPSGFRLPCWGRRTSALCRAWGQTAPSTPTWKAGCGAPMIQWGDNQSWIPQGLLHINSTSQDTCCQHILNNISMTKVSMLWGQFINNTVAYIAVCISCVCGAFTSSLRSRVTFCWLLIKENRVFWLKPRIGPQNRVVF